MVQFPALRDRGEGYGRDRVAVDGGVPWEPATGRGTLEGGLTFVLPHPSRKRRRLDGAQSIEEEPEVKQLAGPPAGFFVNDLINEAEDVKNCLGGS